ncbi:hypothetical protein KY321_01190, partial [Candidatus Woesearchaeota archaeon]|nr:hypothetical protein [Candidatus Woesearchaeota archaeon]
DAQIQFIIETRGQVNIWWLLTYYWWALLLCWILLTLVMNKAYHGLSVVVLDQRVNALRREEKDIFKLIEELQNNAFKKKSISIEEYKITLSEYELRLGEIHVLILSLIGKRDLLNNPDEKLKHLNNEREELMKLVKKNQQNYFVHHKIRKERFNIIETSYNKRLANLDSLIEETKEKIEKKKEKNGENKMNGKTLMFLVLIGILLTTPFFLVKPSITGSAIYEQVITEPKDFVFNETGEITRNQALDDLINSELDLEDMQNLNLSTLYIEDILLIAKRSFVGKNISSLREEISTEGNYLYRDYLDNLLGDIEETKTSELEDKNYTRVERISQVIDFRKVQASNIEIEIELLKEREQELIDLEINTTIAKEFINDAYKSYVEERYDESEIFMINASNYLDVLRLEDLQRKNLLKQTTNLLLRHWWKILIISVLFYYSLKPFIRKVNKKLAKRKIILLQKELKELEDLIVEEQVATFKKVTMSVDKYHLRVKKYRIRIARIKEKIVELNEIIIGDDKSRKKENKYALRIK